MKNPFEIFNTIPKGVVELFAFVSAVFSGAVYKMVKQNEKGIKITFKKMLAEVFVSLFIATCVYGALDQFCHFNKFFAYMMCSLAGSMSSPLHDGFLKLIDAVFDFAKKYMTFRNPPVLLYHIAGLLLLASLTAVPAACAKRTMTSNSFIKDTTTKISHDSIATVEKSKAIIDSLNILIAKVRTAKPECDSVCQAEIDRILSGLNTQKTSGDNSYGAYYDLYTKMLTLYAKIGETANKTTKVKDVKETDTKILDKKEIPVAYIPDFWRYSAYFGWASAVFVVLWVSNKIRKLWQPKLPIT